ncbi:MAG: Na+:solute symporter [Cytophagaceae bacterium]|nr:Na+:solute symporter [Cytophagaceae bacterium]
MQLSLLDIIVIGAYVTLIFAIGFFYRKWAARNTSSYFLGGRKLTWWLAGSSMIATSFAADTPLAVSELVTQNGIAGNWLWWNLLAGGMLTTFFFARLWRKSNLLTDLELLEKRYSGKAASFLRGFRAVYFGLLMNALVIGWVNIALASLLKVFFNVPQEYTLVFIGVAMALAMIYSSLAGFLGTVITDFLEFIFAMGGTTILAVMVINSDKIGGMTGLIDKVPSWSLDFFPKVGGADSSFGGSVGLLTLSITTFLAYITIQWWSSWYPGAEPGGGGAIAQRLLSTKNEQHAIAATLFFQVFHYCLRPWPWIIVGLSVIVLYPDLPKDERRLGYVMAMRDYLPAGVKGLLLMSFFVSYMSTIASQFNWGASYIVNDLYKRFINPDASEKRLIHVSRIAIIMVMILALIITPFLKNISDVWDFMIHCTSGLGLVLILRWYWWRINAWSEITATIVPFIGYTISVSLLDLNSTESLLVTVALTTISWLAVTYFTKPESLDTLQNFYSSIKPAGLWKPIRLSLNMEKNKDMNTRSLIICWISAVAMTYGVLFFVGYIIFRQWNNAFVMLSVISGSFVILAYQTKKNKIFHDSE